MSAERRDALLVAQQRLRRHHDQRLAEVAAHLAAQRVEIVGRRGRHDHLPVVLGRELQVALEPGRAVLGPLPLVAVRQQHHQAVHAQPLALARADELVDDDLRAVGEVAELRLPHHQRIGLGRGVAVLEAQHARLVERAVDHLEARLAGRHVVQRHVAGIGRLVDQHRMALREGAAAGILAAQPHRRAFGQQRAPGQRLAGRPVDVLAGIDGLALLAEQAGDLAVEVEVLGRLGERAADRRSACRSRPRSCPCGPPRPAPR